MHCVAFVIKATTNLNDPDDGTLKKIKALQQRINGPRNVLYRILLTKRLITRNMFLKQ